MGVDWDKYGAGTHIAVCDYFPLNHQDTDRRGKARFLAKTLIPKGEYTLSSAVEKIIQWNSMFQPEHIFVDRGYGEMQVETLLEYGTKHPETHLRKRVKGFAFNESIDVYTPEGKETKELKHFMVDCTHRLFEEKLLLIPADEEELYRQLIAYMVIRTTQLGKPVFEGVNSEDHLLDAFMLCMLAISIEFLEWTKVHSEANHFVPMASGSLHSLIRAPENEREEEIAETLRDKGMGIATKRSFTPSTKKKKISSKGIRRTMI
jgi:replicative DNA helicase